MEKLLNRSTVSGYSISKKPFYEWVSKNLPRFKGINVIEIDNVSHELWDSLYKNFSRSNIAITSPVESRLDHCKKELSGFQLDYKAEHSYNLTCQDHSIDMVISNNKDFIKFPKTMDEVERVLKHGGIFINLVNGVSHIHQLKELFNRGRGIEKSLSTDIIKTTGNLLSKEFQTVNYRDYKRELNISNPNNILGYYLSNRNPKVRQWALEDSQWILSEANRLIRENGYFSVDINLGMFVCTL